MRVRIILVALLAAGCTRTTPGRALGVAVKVMVPDQAQTQAVTRYSAEIVPQTRLDLAFRCSGYLETIAMVSGPKSSVPGFAGRQRPLQEGDRVALGETLATIRTTEYAQQAAEARARVAEASSAYRQARRESSRDAKLARSGSIPEAAFDASRSQRDRASAALQAAKARLAQAKAALGDTTLVSPMNGVVLRRSLEVGALVAPGTVAFSLADVSSVKAVFGVPDVLLSRIQVGSTQKVTSDAFRDVEFAGEVTRVAPAADLKSHVFEVEVTIPNADDRLKPGMVVALARDAVANDSGPRVPLAAVVRAPSGKGFAVFVVERAAGDTIARARTIELGDYVGRMVPVTKGLDGTEQVVVLGAALLSDGERVEVIP